MGYIKRLSLLFIFFTIFLAQEPENVFVIVIDGIRNDEAFESESLYIRNIWNNLRPLGTIYRRFWNRGWTATTAGHNTIASGVRQITRNNAQTYQDIKPNEPTFFEYFRKTFGLPETTAGALMGKSNCRCVDFGLEPSYGENYKGFLIYGAPDTTISNWVHRVMDSLHPRLLFVNLREVDEKGHSGNFLEYLQAIRVADSIVYEFYKHIQAIPPYTDTFYRNKTVMMVTTDHGRNDNAHGGFKGHGEWDHGCRDLMFLALGPGIRENTIITSVDRDHIDILPTVGYILGFPTYFAEGDVMREIFVPDFKPKRVKKPLDYSFDFVQNLSNTEGFSREPEIAVDREGKIHLVWMDNTRGKWEVYYRKSSDGGETWSPIRILFDFPNKDSVMWFARVAADDSLIVSAMGYAKVGQYIDSVIPSRMDTTFIWYPWIATSIDGGDNWSITSLPDSNMGSYASPVAVHNGRFSIAYWLWGKFPWERTEKGLYFNWRNPRQSWRELPSKVCNRQLMRLSLIDDGNSFHIAGSAFYRSKEDWEIGYWRSFDGDSWTGQWITNDTGANVFFDYDPSIIKDGAGNLHIIWARKEDVGGNWQIYHSKSTDNGNTWSEKRQISSTPADAWKPDITCKGETLYVVWSDYRDGNSEIYCRRSTDGGTTWLPEERVTYNNSFSVNPKAEVWNDKLVVVWQDYQEGNWEIFFKRLSSSVGVGEENDNYPIKIYPTIMKEKFLINFFLTSPSKVDIHLYDIKGNYIDKIVEGKFKKGNHQILLKRGKIPKGVYFIILRIDGKLSRKKIISIF